MPQNLRETLIYRGLFSKNKFTKFVGNFQVLESPLSSEQNIVSLYKMENTCGNNHHRDSF